MWNESDLKKALKIADFHFPHTCSGLSIDSRTTQKDDLFIALRGDNKDGHYYVQDALSKGALLAIVEEFQEGVSASKQIIVPDSYKALDQLARFARNRVQQKGRIVAITGSSGKTTVKECFAFILKKFGRTTSSKASYNNDIGVPYSLAHLESSTDFGVFEIGMNNPGEIVPLTMMIQPHLAIITSIGESHIGRMGSLMAIAEEKSEVMRGLDATGTVIFPSDAPHSDVLYAKARSLSLQSIHTFGKDEKADARLISFEPSEDGIGGRVNAIVQGKELSYDIAMPGEHSALNSLVILLACSVFNLDESKILSALKDFSSVQGRGQRHMVPFKDGHILLIDDAYNANPSSMRAGLATLSILPKTKDGRKIAVLGDMKELGQGSPDYHKALALVVESVGIDLVFAVGEEMKHLYDALPKSKKGGYSLVPEDILPKIKHTVHPSDILFVKGSKSSYISKVVDFFLSEL